MGYGWLSIKSPWAFGSSISSVLTLNHESNNLCDLVLRAAGEFFTITSIISAICLICNITLILKC